MIDRRLVNSCPFNQLNDGTLSSALVEDEKYDEFNWTDGVGRRTGHRHSDDSCRTRSQG